MGARIAPDYNLPPPFLGRLVMWSSRSMPANVQLVGNNGQFGCRPWSVLLAKLVNCCGKGGHVAGVLHVLQPDMRKGHSAASCGGGGTFRPSFPVGKPHSNGLW